MKKFATALMLALAIAAVSADGAQAANTTVTSLISRIYPSSNGFVLFRLKTDSCNTNNKYYSIDTASSVGADSYKLLLASALAGQAISVTVPGCGFTANQPIVYLFQDY